MYKGIDHIALAVSDIEAAADFYQKVFQLQLVSGLSLPADGVHMNIIFSFGPHHELELMGPLGDDGFLVSFLKTHGPGIHHLALEVTDIDTATRTLADRGVDIFGTAGEKGMRFTFLHPRSTLRTGMQLMQRNPQKAADNPLVKGIDHVAVKVISSTQGRDFFVTQLGAEAVTGRSDSALDCACDHYRVGEARFRSLYAFTGPSPVQAPEGLHHIGIRVDDLEKALRHLKTFGVVPLQKWSTEKSVFLSPEKMYGCLWRLIETP